LRAKKNVTEPRNRRDYLPSVATLADVALRKRLDLALAGGIFALALGIRLSLLKAAPYGDETAHYTMARTLGFLDSSVYWIDADAAFRLYPLVVSRPVFALALSPGAAFGFEAFRFLGITYAALLPVLVYALARKLQSRMPAAFLAGLVIAVHPTFTVWGSRIFPDTLMAGLVLGALLAYASRRTRLAAALMLLACLTKETAVPAAAGLAFHAFLVALRQNEEGADAWTRLKPGLWFLGAALLGTGGVIASYMLVPRLPGWTSGGTLTQAVDALTLWPWLFLVPLAGFLDRRFGAPALALASTLVFYVVFVTLRDGNVNGWYVILPAALAVLLAVAGLDKGMKSQEWPRLAAVTLAAAFFFACTVAVIGGGDDLSEMLHPGTERVEAGLASSIGYANAENPWLADAIDFQEQASPRRVLSMDLGWFWLSYPFRGTDQTAFSYTVQSDPDKIPLDDLVSRAEGSDLTWLQDWNSTFHQAFKATYADCQVFAADILTAYRIQDCRGRLDGLRLALAHRQ
jgi:hypothetical protein